MLENSAMIRRVLFTSVALVLAAAAFCGADPDPDINLFGVLFLFCAFVLWFFWREIQAGYAFQEDVGILRGATSGLIFIRFAPFLLRQLAAQGRRGR